MNFNADQHKVCTVLRNRFFSLQDNVIYERLAPNQKYEEATLIHLEEFATMGEYQF